MDQPEKINNPLCQRGIQGDLIVLQVAKSPLTPLCQRGEIRFQKATKMLANILIRSLETIRGQKFCENPPDPFRRCLRAAEPNLAIWDRAAWRRVQCRPASAHVPWSSRDLPPLSKAPGQRKGLPHWGDLGAPPARLQSARQ